MNADGTELRRLDNCEGYDHPQFWSVDGKWIIVRSTHGLDLYAYDVNGGQRVPLAHVGKIKMYDQRYYPWRVIDSPVCVANDFWSCE